MRCTVIYVYMYVPDVGLLITIFSFDMFSLDHQIWESSFKISLNK